MDADLVKAFMVDAEQALVLGSLGLEQFIWLQRIWSTEAFGPSPPRGPAGPLKHLAKEVPEALERVAELDALLAEHAATRPADAADAADAAVRELQVAAVRDALLGELVDCQFLIFDAVWRAGFGTTDLRRGLGRKLAINRNRVWPTMAPDQAVEHDRSGEPK